MKKGMRFTYVSAAAVILLGTFLPARVSAATVPAASCAASAVQAAINLAFAGDTVKVPAGDCTWATTVTVTGKRLTLTGAGIGVTTIRDNTTSGEGALNVRASAAHFVNISGFTFVKTRANASGMVQIWGTVGEIVFRFHHSRLFDNAVLGGRGIATYGGYGLIDHVTFDVTSSYPAQMISPSGSPEGGDGGFTPWMQPLDLGTQNAIYVEDCTFTGGPAEDIIDAYSGARLVVRHSTFTNSAVGLHGTDSGARSPVLLEMYNNVFTNDGADIRRAVTNRGGTGLYFNNTFGGTRGYTAFVLILYRATVNLSYSWGKCDGTQSDIGSTVFSQGAARTAVPYGTVARFLASSPDTVCTGSTSGDCSRALDGTGSRGYPCRDQPGRGPGQALNPVYAWNNSGATAQGANSQIVAYDGGCDACAGYPMATWLAENRDYYNPAANFNGTVGTGRGTLANRPATCTPLTAYFATDVGAQGTLYQCATTNTWSLYYTPFQYPHPLQGPEPPANVIVR